MKQHNHELTDRLAAEYALGTLQGAARRRFERWLKADRRLRDTVQQWQLRLARLTTGKVVTLEAPVEPPADVWRSLERRLFADAPAAPAAAPRWFERLAVWRTLTAGSSLLAGVLAVLLIVQRPGPDTGGNDYIVLIQNQQQQPIWTASASADFGQLKVRNLKPMTMPADAGCLLWVQPSGSDRLYPLGLLPDDGTMVKLDIAAQLRDKIMDGKLLVTVENRHDYPQSPTGSAAYRGRVVALDNNSI